MKATLHRIGNIAGQIRGVTYSKKDATSTADDGFLPVLRAGNITDEGLTYEDLVYVPSSKISPKQMVKKNDIVIAASSGSIEVVGKAARAREDFDGSFGAFCKVLRPSKEVNPAYFSHFFQTPEYRRRVSFLAAGANINNLRNGDLDNLEIPLPPLAEQKRIAGILDTADALRAKRRKSLAELDTLLKSTFLGMFRDPVTNPMGWEEKTIEEIVSDTKLGLVRSSKEFGWDFTIPYVRMDALTIDGKFLHEKVQFTDASDKERDSFALQPDDFLFNTRNSKELVGKVCVYTGPQGWLFNNNLMRIRFKGGIKSSVIAAQFQFQRVQRALEQRKSGTTSVFAVYWKSLKTLPVLVPPLDLQHRFAAIVESTEQQKGRQRAHLAELDTLFASLQQRAFNGEL